MNSNNFQKGSQLVEFTLLLPFILLFVFGTFEFCLMLYDKAVINNASREAARSGVALKTPALTSAEIKLIANNYCIYLVSLGAKTNCQVTPDPIVPTNIISGQSTLTVSISYDYTPLVIGRLFDMVTLGKFPNTIRLTSDTKMVYE
jgi:Flp pilus assembly protein TadG